VLQEKIVQPRNLITSIPAGCDVAIAMVSLELIAHGYYVANTFELDSACGSLGNNICAHHGESPCECQLKVLQVFDKPSRSLHLIFHTYQEVTELYLDCEEIDVRHDLESELRQILLQESFKIQRLIDAQISQFA
jgi:hypothetical protein